MFSHSFAPLLLAIFLLAFTQSKAQVTVSVSQVRKQNENCNLRGPVVGEYSVSIQNTGSNPVCSVVINVEGSTSGCCNVLNTPVDGQYVGGVNGLTQLDAYPSKRFRVPEGTRIEPNSSYDSGYLVMLTCVGAPTVSVVNSESC